MSSEGQPRKRKDKRRKKGSIKEDVIGLDQETPIHTVPVSKTPSTPVDDCNIHIHHDASTGGGWCAKIIFFCLLSGLFLLIGIILLEYRGSTDLDTPATESKYAQFFDGWVDDAPQLHDDEDEEHGVAESDEHGDEDEHGDDGEHGDEDENEHSEEHAVSEEEEISNEDADQLAYKGHDPEDDDDTADAPDDDTEENLEEDAAEDDDGSEAVDDASPEQEVEEDEEEVDQDVSNEEQEQSTEVNASQAEDSIEDEMNESDNTSPEDLQDVLDNMDDDEPLDEVTESNEAGLDNEDSDEEVIDNNAGEAKLLAEQEVEGQAEEEEPSGVAVKFGVGVALVVVAHLVLVRKWTNASSSTSPPSASTAEEISSDLSRRNTIVPNAENVVDLEHEIEIAKHDEYEVSGDEDADEDEDDDDEELEPKFSFYNPTPGFVNFSRNLEPEVDRKLTSNIESAFRRISPAPKVDEYEPEEEEEEEEDEEEEVEVEEEHEDEVEEDDEEEEVEEDDDEELLKKLEAKYGKLSSKQIEASDDEARKQVDSDDDGEVFPSWKRVKAMPDNGAEETDSDREIPPPRRGGPQSVDDFDEDEFLAGATPLNNSIEVLAARHREMAQAHPTVPKTLYDLARTLDALADQKRSNDILTKAIEAYKNLLTNGDNVPKEMFVKAALRCINRIRFRGEYANAIEIHNMLINKLPDTPVFRNQLAVTYLLMNAIARAKMILMETLQRWPSDGFALTHYGFILKTAENNIKQGVEYLQRGIMTRDQGTVDGRFYFHLGDGYMRLGLNDKAMQVYCDGVKEGLFLSKYQRSLYNVNRLTGRPWWTKHQTTYEPLLDTLENNWKVIRNEGLNLLNAKGLYKDEAENLRDKGNWKQFELYARGKKVVKNCEKTPFTCRIIDGYPVASKCRRGQVKFSVMHPGTHVWPHCGPTNCRLRVHLPLKIPPKTYIRVADETRKWQEGRVLIFDDSFEHEVWHNGSDIRLVLIVDLWHPELTTLEKQTLPVI